MQKTVQARNRPNLGAAGKESKHLKELKMRRSRHPNALGRTSLLWLGLKAHSGKLSLQLSIGGGHVMQYLFALDGSLGLLLHSTSTSEVPHKNFEQSLQNMHNNMNFDLPLHIEFTYLVTESYV